MATKQHQERFVAKSLTHLDDNFLDCRDPSTGHKWERLEDFHVVPATTEGRRTTHVARKFQCERCTVVKTERYIIVKRGIERLERIGTAWDYPEGYLMPGVPRGVKPAEIVRAEQYRRSLERAVKAHKGQRAAAER